MLHRFASADGTRGGHDGNRLREILASLRDAGVHFASLDAVIRARLGEGDPLPGPTVVFTVDDCYPDLQETGIPVFDEFDCPVTGFVVPEVIDRRCWFWWDQVEWITRHSTRTTLSVELAGSAVTLAWTDEPTRHRAARAFVEQLKPIPSDALTAGVVALADAAELSLPEAPPEEYRVLSWADLRALEARGHRFGAHTMTHPLLSRSTREQATWEISASLARVRKELAHPSDVFAFPVGRWQDFGEREMGLVEQAGLLASVSAEPGVLPHTLHARTTGPGSRWAIPRFAYDERPGAMARLLLL